MKVNDIPDKTLRDILASNEYGRLVVDMPKGKGDAYGFLKVKLDERFSTLLVCRKYLRAEATDDAHHLIAADLIDNDRIDKLCSVIVVENATETIVVNTNSGIGYEFFATYFSDADLDAMQTHELISALNEDACQLKASARSQVADRVISSIFEALGNARPVPATEWFNEHGRPIQSYALMAEAYVEGKGYESYFEGERIANGAIDGDILRKLSLGAILLYRLDAIDACVDAILSRTSTVRVDDAYETIPWTESVAHTIATNKEIAAELRANPPSSLVTRREMYAALHDAFPEQAERPKTVKVTLDAIPDVQLALEYNALHLALSVYGGNIYEMHFAAKDRERLSGPVNPEAIASVSYRGKTIYRKAS